MNGNQSPLSKRKSGYWALLLAGLLLATVNAHAKRLHLDYMIDGVERSAIAYVPKQSKTTPRSLIIVYHGRGDDSRPFASAVQLHRDWPDAIVVYPRGLTSEKRPTMRGWQYRAGDSDDRDLQLTDRILADLTERFEIHPKRRYAAGFSNGAHFVFLLMRERSEAFNGFAAIGAIAPDFSASATPRPLLYLFGQQEPAQYASDWEKTVKALARFNRAGASDDPFLDCCRLLGARETGADFAYGAYNAGHIWPNQGNRWLREFFQRYGETPAAGRDR